MKFLVDANLPPGLAVWLRDLGHDADHVFHLPGLTSVDAAVFEFARRGGHIIVTKDEDFAALLTLAADPPSVVWLRLGNATNAQLKRWLEPLLPEIIERLGAGERLIEVV